MHTNYNIMSKSSCYLANIKEPCAALCSSFLIYGAWNIIVETKTQNEEICIISNYRIVDSILLHEVHAKAFGCLPPLVVDVRSETFSHCNLVILKQVYSQITYNTFYILKLLSVFGTFHYSTKYLSSLPYWRICRAIFSIVECCGRCNAFELNFKHFKWTALINIKDDINVLALSSFMKNQ